MISRTNPASTVGSLPIEHTRSEAYFIQGDDETKAQLEAQTAAYDPNDYWSVHEQQISVKARRSISAMAKETPASHNMYEKYPTGRQLSETVAEFLARLPPSSTSISEGGPWIYIANPRYVDRPLSEDLPRFREVGQRLLDKYTALKEHTEASMNGKPAATVTKKLMPHRKQLEKDIIVAAREHGIKGGKWMLFLSAEKVDAVWSLVAHAVAESELGHAAKVAADDGKSATRLICIYTEDHKDVADVKRVLQRLVDLDLVKEGNERGIYYKADALTYLDIMSGNQWGLKPTLYSSKEMLAPGKK